MKFALIGAGSRGLVYSRYAYHSRGIEIAAVVEPDDTRRSIAAAEFGIPADRQFSDPEAFFALGRICNAVIIASMDRDHYREAMDALALRYDILLEKPISPDPAECVRLRDRAESLGCAVVVCHVLRYTPFFIKIKEILDSGRLGRIITINHSENIGNFHMAHSFVRGNWRNSEMSSPLIMQKSCHDMDLLVWLTGSKARRISSFGDLTYFKEENAPAGSTDRCLDCPAADGCRYAVQKTYLRIPGIWPADTVSTTTSREELREILRTSPYGRCVYRCDNDVCDHQVTIIEFENGVTANFHLCGFTNKVHRTIRIMCENGEIEGDDTGVIAVSEFASNGIDSYTEEVVHPEVPTSGHAGGDNGLMDDFISFMEHRDSEKSRSDISVSVESHLMAAAAEESRLTGRTVDMETVRQDFAV